MLDLLSGESDEVKAYLEDDLEYIQDPTDLHLVVMMRYNNYILAKILDLVVKPGTTVTPEGTTTVISTIDAPDADAPFYDLQGCRVSHPHKGIYIRNGKKVRR